MDFDCFSFTSICPTAKQQIEEKAAMGLNVYGLGRRSSNLGFPVCFPRDVPGFRGHTDSHWAPSVPDSMQHSITDIHVLSWSSHCYLSEGLLGLPNWGHNIAVGDSCCDWPAQPALHSIGRLASSVDSALRTLQMSRDLFSR